MNTSTQIDRSDRQSFTFSLRHLWLASFTSICAIAFACPASAAPVYSGYRTASSGAIIADDDWSTSIGGFRIDFSVTFNGSMWSYDYKFRDNDDTWIDPEVTRFLKLEVSNVKGAVYDLVSDGHLASPGTLIPLTPQSYSFHLWDAPASDPSYGLYGIFVGDDNDNLDDELTDGHITILSSQGPKWGSFYVRGPNSSGTGPAEATNRGLNNGVFPKPTGGMYSSVGSPPSFDPSANMNGYDVKNWILVPDSTPVPEPATFVLALPAAFVLAIARRRARSRKMAA